jgi:hypothetical protein
MKKILQISFLFGAILIMVASCKKNDINNPVSLVEKWNKDQLILWTTIKSGGVTTTTKDTTVYTGTGSYVDLRTDGNAYEKSYDFSFNSYSYDTATYSVSGSTFTAVKGVETTAWTIQKLTGNSLQLYRKSTNGSATLISELWLILSR